MAPSPTPASAASNRRLQEHIISTVKAQPSIDVDSEIERRTQFLVDYLNFTGASGYVLGISGGVDSTVAGKLAQRAVEAHRAEYGSTVRFTAVRLPYLTQHDEADAAAAMDFIDADRPITFQIGPATDALAKEFAFAMGEDISDYNLGNVKARVRMVAQYAIAGMDGGLVIGSDQAAESATGFYTKFGDGAADVVPLTGLTKRQVMAMARRLGASEQLWAKVPTADLLDENPGRTDEDELKLSYADLDDYLEGRSVPDAAANRVEELFTRSRHKRALPVGPDDAWWQR